MSERDVGEGHLGLDAQNGGRGEAAIAAGVPVFDDGDAVVALRGVAQRVAEGSGVAVARQMRTRKRGGRSLPSPSVNWSQSSPKVPTVRELKAGDWVCGKCGAQNFACRKTCFHCHDVPQEIRRCVHVLDESEVRPGDWLCYECNTVVFASKHRCYKCKAPRDGAEPVIRFPVHTYKDGD